MKRTRARNLKRRKINQHKKLLFQHCLREFIDQEITLEIFSVPFLPRATIEGPENGFSCCFSSSSWKVSASKDDKKCSHTKTNLDATGIKVKLSNGLQVF